MRVILSGSTGFIGSELAKSLILDPQIAEIQLLIRPMPGLHPQERLARLVRTWLSNGLALEPQDLQKVSVHACDLTDRKYFVDLRPADFMIHLAASTALGDSIAVARRSNLFSTQNALGLARQVKGLQRFIHLSTAYVAGTQKGRLKEARASLDQRFHNSYERSKLEAEKCVTSFGLPYTILRPSIVVGRSDNGYAPKMQVLYSAWRAWLSGYLPRAPLDPEAWVDLIPLDYACDAIRALAFDNDTVGKTLHICAGEGRVRSGDILSLACRTFGRRAPKLAPPWIVDYLRLPFISRHLTHQLRSMIDVMRWHVPYLGMRDRLFDNDETRVLLEKYRISCPHFSTYGTRIFDYLQKTAWGKRPLTPEIARLLKEDSCSA